MQMKELRRIRESRGLSRNRLGEMTNLSPHTIYSHEVGRISNPTQETIEVIASALQVPEQSLFFSNHTDTSIKVQLIPSIAAAIQAARTTQHTK